MTVKRPEMDSSPKYSATVRAVCDKCGSRSKKASLSSDFFEDVELFIDANVKALAMTVPQLDIEVTTNDWYKYERAQRDEAQRK